MFGKYCPLIPRQSSSHLVVVGDVHGRPAEDVGGPDQAGEANLVAEVLGRSQVLELLPLGLPDADLVQHPGELVPVLGVVNVLGRGAENGHLLPEITREKNKPHIAFLNLRFDMLDTTTDLKSTSMGATNLYHMKGWANN